MKTEFSIGIRTFVLSRTAKDKRTHLALKGSRHTLCDARVTAPIHAASVHVAEGNTVLNLVTCSRCRNQIH